MTSPNTISFSLLQQLGTAASLMDAVNNSAYIIGRVVYVLLDDSNQEKFNKLGGWKNIGTIEFLPFINFNDPDSDPIIAKPLNTNITKFPLENEVVLVKKLISKKAQDNLGNYSPEYYYTDIISVFNATEQNALPDASFFKKNPNSKSVTGLYNSKGDVKRLIKAPGDITIESRRGTSIRMGSNIEGFKTPWKNTESKPIFVLSHNPAKVSGSMEVRFEDINKDGTSIVIMSGHNIGFQAASFNFDSYEQKYDVPQKQNVVVTDQKVESEPEKSLQQTDSNKVQKDTPVTGSLPVKVETAPSNTTKKVEDEEELPEREDLFQIDVIVEEVPVSLGTVGSSNLVLTENDTKLVENAATKSYLKVHTNRGQEYTRIVASYTTKTKGFIDKLNKKVAIPYRINLADLLTFMAFESGGKWEYGLLGERGKAKAVGLIQFTDAKEGSVFQALRKKFPDLKNLSDILDVPPVLNPNTKSKYNFDQIDLVEYYFQMNKSRATGADRYALYAIIFYPLLVKSGRIDPKYGDNFILGTEKSWQRAVTIGRANSYINGGYPISLRAFKNMIDSLYSK